MRLSWLPAVLRRAGLHVVEVDGWQGRGRPLETVEGIVWHHTATSMRTPDRAVALVLRDGHSTLPGPLAQLGVDRSGRWWLIADGRCNHNGYGTWGNNAVGVEAFNDGTEPWTQKQLDSWCIGTAAILARFGWQTDRLLAHKETDPRRKRDPHTLDMNEVRRRVATLQSVVPRPPAADEDDTMRYPHDRPYATLTIGGDGLGSLHVPVPFRDVTSVVVKANDNGTIPVAVVLPGAALDPEQTVLWARGEPGAVGVIVGYRRDR